MIFPCCKCSCQEHCIASMCPFKWSIHHYLSDYRDIREIIKVQLVSLAELNPEVFLYLLSRPLFELINNRLVSEIIIFFKEIRIYNTYFEVIISKAYSLLWVVLADSGPNLELWEPILFDTGVNFLCYNRIYSIIKIY